MLMVQLVQYRLDGMEMVLRYLEEGLGQLERQFTDNNEIWWSIVTDVILIIGFVNYILLLDMVIF